MIPNFSGIVEAMSFVGENELFVQEAGDENLGGKIPTMIWRLDLPSKKVDRLFTGDYLRLVQTRDSRALLYRTGCTSPAWIAHREKDGWKKRYFEPGFTITSAASDKPGRYFVGGRSCSTIANGEAAGELRVIESGTEKRYHVNTYIKALLLSDLR